jgi:acetyl-CoA carboxylase, biotin carboxylase subunit
LFSTVLVANRGEIALRILRTCRDMGIRGVLAHSTADAGSPAARFADQTIQIGPTEAQRSYLNHAAIVQAALSTGADAVHPGYGFLSEDSHLAEACALHGLTFVGPSAGVLARLGHKATARDAAVEVRVPVLPGNVMPVRESADALAVADEIGYPVIVKAVAGGGGRGMAVVSERARLVEEFERTVSMAAALFGDSSVYVEKYLHPARHVEVQVLADSQGNIVTLGARDCSVQRRRQKLIEETPPPGLSAEVLAGMYDSAVTLACAVGYTGAGTFEFLVGDDGRFHFLEANCRIQVEHPVTEAVTGIDLVRQQLLIAGGEPMEVLPGIPFNGAAMECRINAEDPMRGFLPTAGPIHRVVFPAGPFVRVDSAVCDGAVVSAAYDSLLAKVIVWAPNRGQAIARMCRALSEVEVRGDRIVTTTEFLAEVLRYAPFAAGAVHTGIAEEVLATREAAALR